MDWLLALSRDHPTVLLLAELAACLAALLLLERLRGRQR